MDFYDFIRAIEYIAQKLNDNMKEERKCELTV